ncbi:hypothetical protein KM043_009801 [Ampulex compressa]|nr:hypothetical protein KM043_009801 [Ampulex compressa]
MWLLSQGLGYRQKYVEHSAAGGTCGVFEIEETTGRGTSNHPERQQVKREYPAYQIGRQGHGENPAEYPSKRPWYDQCELEGVSAAIGRPRITRDVMRARGGSTSRERVERAASCRGSNVREPRERCHAPKACNKSVHLNLTISPE